MYQCLVVHEFDIITTNKDYKGYQRYQYLDNRYFKELELFINEYEPEDESDLSEFFTIRSMAREKTIVVKNYVGIIELPSGFQIEVLPKIDFLNKDSGDNISRAVFLDMLNCYWKISNKSIQSAFLDTYKGNLFEVFVSMYIEDVVKLVSHGIKSSYNYQEDNLHFFKGKLKVSENIKRNLAHKERFYMMFDEYTVNRPENKIVKATLLYLLKKSSSADNVRRIRQLLSNFEMVEASKNYVADLARITLGRDNKDYEMLIKWSEVFLSGKTFTSFSGETESKALLFPMEKLFEGYVAQWVWNVFGRNGWNVSRQEETLHLFDEPETFTLRPDIIARKGDVTVIMDTKWKRLTNEPEKNYGISQVDMYQMYAYSKKYSVQDGIVPEVWLLYPYCKEANDIGEPVFTSKDGVKVHICFVNVNIQEIENSICEFLNKVEP